LINASKYYSYDNTISIFAGMTDVRESYVLVKDIDRNFDGNFVIQVLSKEENNIKLIGESFFFQRQDPQNCENCKKK